jgi:hypothetical protein
MSLRDKIKVAAKRLNPYDGSLEAVTEWERIIDDEKEMEVLLQQAGFRSLIDAMAREFRARLEEVIKNDPELTAQKRMFDRTLGLKGAKKEINKIVDELIEVQDD